MGLFYRHLTSDDRIVIKTLLQEEKSMPYIAERLGRSISTIRREIKRNSGLRGYRHKQAHQKAEARKKLARTVKLTPEIIAMIDDKIKEDYSPEQICSRLKMETEISLSHETVYQHILKDKKNGGKLYNHLRINNGRRKRKRYGKNDFRGRIPGRVGIEERPAIVDKKERFGDWEADLMSGSHHRGFLVTLVERKSKLTMIGHVERKTTDEVCSEIIRLFSKTTLPVLTITYDNGREFSLHELINLSLGCRSYFARPYHSWERGLVENTNGLIRQYFPKQTDLRKVDPDHIDFVQGRLNNRPRKTLDYDTPEEVLLKAS